MTPKQSKRDQRQNNVHLPPALRAQWHAAAKTRAQLRDQPRPNYSQIIQEALQQFLPTLDPATGEPRREAPANPAPATVIVTPTALPHFSEFINIHQYAVDDELFRAMDRSFLMCWAAAPDWASLHASKQLADFTGIHASEFRGAGWVNALHSEDRAGCIALCAKEFPTQRSFILAYRLKCVYGFYSFVIDTAEPRWRPDGSFAGYIGTLHQVAPLRLSTGQLAVVMRPPS